MRTVELKGSKNSSSSSHFRMISPMGTRRINNIITRLRHVGRLLEIITALDARVTQLLDNLRKRGFNHFTQCCKLNGRLNAMKLRSKQKKCTLNLPEF